MSYSALVFVRDRVSFNISSSYPSLKIPFWLSDSLNRAAVLIYCGSAKTKKHQAVSEKLRQAMGIPIAIGQPAIGYPNVGEDLRSKERGEEGDDGDEDGIVEEGRRGERARAQVERAPDGGVMVGVGSGVVNRGRLSGGDERDNEKDEEDDAEEGEAEDRRGVKHESPNILTPLLRRNKHHPQRRATVTFGRTASISPPNPSPLHPQPLPLSNRHHHLLQKRHRDNTMPMRLPSFSPSSSPCLPLALKAEAGTSVKPDQQGKDISSIGVRRVESNRDEKGDMALGEK